MTQPEIIDVIAELAAEATSGFRASYIARRTDRAVGEIHAALAKMVESSDLTVEYQLLCPDDGAVLKRYGPDDELPIGQTIERDDCETFVVTDRHIWVSYQPTEKLLAAMLKDARSRKKARARRRGLLHRAREALATGSLRRRRWRRTFTSM